MEKYTDVYELMQNNEKAEKYLVELRYSAQYQNEAYYYLAVNAERKQQTERERNPNQRAVIENRAAQAYQQFTDHRRQHQAQQREAVDMGQYKEHFDKAHQCPDKGPARHLKRHAFGVGRGR